MKVVYSPEHKRLVPPYSVEAGVQGAPPDVPDRAEAILRDLQADDGFAIEAPTEHGLEPILALHDPGLVAFLETAWDRWTAEGRTQPLYPDTFMHRSLRDGIRPVREPESVLARMGYWCFETFTPIVEGSYTAARAAVDVALTGADLLLAGEPIVYGLCRPPGHHVGQRIFGGSSYLNNAAIAAESIVRRTGEPVAILDLDYHHGNGTQQLFYERPDVLYVSLHGDPVRAWPYSRATPMSPVRPRRGSHEELPTAGGVFGRAVYRGPRRGVEISLVTGRRAWSSRSVRHVSARRRGSRTHELGLPRDRWSCREGGRPTLVLQEGGYYVPHLGRNAVQWLRGAEGRAFEPTRTRPEAYRHQLDAYP